MIKRSSLLVVLCMSLLAACASAPQASLQDFNGTWVVDMDASHAVNPSLAERNSIRDFMSQVTMEIDVEQKQMTIISAEHEEKIALPFVILAQQQNTLRIRIDDGADGGAADEMIHLQLDGGQLIFKVTSTPNNRDDFVFVRKP